MRIHVYRFLGNCYSQGAPETICINHVPHHSHTPQQTSESPYSIRVTPASYDPGDVLTGACVCDVTGPCVFARSHKMHMYISAKFARAIRYGGVVAGGPDGFRIQHRGDAFCNDDVN